VRLGRRLLRGGVHAAIAVLLLWLPDAVRAGTTGKISGRVRDQDRSPVVGATVAVLDQPLGAFTDETGLFNIINVPPGNYSLRVSFVGYETVIIERVAVSADNTTDVDAVIKETTIAAAEIVISAKSLPIDLDLTDTRASLESREIEELPVQDLADVVNLQAGVVDGHFRGGRKGEVQYQVDGVSINNPYDNSSTLTLDRSVLHEVQVISGTFDAEYGQAMSGVVNAVLKDGGENFRWNGEFFLGSYFYPEDGSRPVDWDAHPASTQNYQATIGGPLLAKDTRYILSARYARSSDPYYGTRWFVPTDSSDFEQKIWRPTGDRAEVPLGYRNEWSGLGKLSHSFNPEMKLGYQIIFDLEESQRSDYYFVLNPDGLTEQNTYAVNHGFDWNQSLSPETILDLSLRHNHFHYTDWAYEDVYDPRYDEAGPARGDPDLAEGAYIQGVSLARFEQRTNTLLAKGALASQVNGQHLVKGGGEVYFPRVEFGTPGWLAYATVEGRQQLVRHIDDPPDYPAPIQYRPIIGDAFIQDQMEWEDLTLRAGLRFDYFSARSYVPGDPANPANSITGAPVVPDQATTAKANLSPRLGVAYPIGERAGIHLAYGHFYQYPAIGTIFDNSDYRRLENLQAGGIDYGVMGNPDVKPEKTVQYEIGYRQAVTNRIGIDATAFYKDIRDLLGVEFITTYNNAEYARLTNVDFGEVVGVTLSMDFLEYGPLGIAIDYTWQQATGNSSDPKETSTRAETGEDPRPRQIPFNWDQRHTFNATITYAEPRYSLSAIIRAASGQPYTPVLDAGYGFGLEANSGRKPSGLLLDLRGAVPVKANGTRVSLFGRVFNVLDNDYFNGDVFPSTGSPHYSRFPEADAAALANPTRLYSPRRLEFGFRLGEEVL
jgi:outer membrane receptor protein involved in Fe transport